MRRTGTAERPVLGIASRCCVAGEVFVCWCVCTGPRFHANATRFTRVPRLSLRVSTGRSLPRMIATDSSQAIPSDGVPLP